MLTVDMSQNKHSKSFTSLLTLWNISILYWICNAMKIEIPLYFYIAKLSNSLAPNLYA